MEFDGIYFPGLRIKARIFISKNWPRLYVVLATVLLITIYVCNVQFAENRGNEGEMKYGNNNNKIHLSLKDYICL